MKTGDLLLFLFVIVPRGTGTAGTGTCTVAGTGTVATETRSGKLAFHVSIYRFIGSPIIYRFH